MFKKTLFLIVFPILVVGCAGVQTQPPPPQEVVVKVQAAEPTDVNAEKILTYASSLQMKDRFERVPS